MAEDTCWIWQYGFFFFFKRNGILCCHFCHLHNLWCIPAIVSFAISDNIFVANWQWNLVFREDIFRYIQSKIYLQPMLNKYTLLFCLILYPYLAFINLILDIKIIPFSLLKIKSKKKKVNKISILVIAWRIFYKLYFNRIWDHVMFFPHPMPQKCYPHFRHHHKNP